MNNKKKVSFFIFLFIVGYIAYSNDLEKMIKNNEFNFVLKNQNGSYGGYVYNNHDKWECNFGINFLYFGFDSRIIYEDRVEIAYVTSAFLLYGDPYYREYSFPKKSVISITKQQIEERINSIKSGNNKKNKEIYKNEYVVNAECNGLIIADNVRIREEPNIMTGIKIIGKLKKFEKITIIDISDNINKIDNLNSCWYKIRLEDGTEGWVFGGFAKIYFDDEDLQLLYKAFEKEGSEYTNQFPTPDKS